jgi:hypothetical protein
MDDATRTIYINTDINAYENFLPSEWVTGVFEKAKAAPYLDSLLLDFTQSWRAIAYTASMPFLFVRSIQGAVLGYARYKTSDASIVSFGDQVLDRVANETSREFGISRKIRRTIAKRISAIATEFREQRAKIELQMPIDEIWQNFYRDDGYVQGVWSSQRVAFLAFYNEYEAFLIQCAKEALGKTSFRITDKGDKKEFYDLLRSKFDTNILDICWLHSEINIARVVRNSLSHSGGKETDDLKGLNHGFKFMDGKLQIGPEHIHRLLRHLRAGVTAFVAAAAIMPIFATMPNRTQNGDD